MTGVQRYNAEYAVIRLIWLLSKFNIKSKDRNEGFWAFDIQLNPIVSSSSHSYLTYVLRMERHNDWRIGNFYSRKQ